MRARLHSNRRPLPRVTHPPASRGEGAGELLKGPRGKMLAVGLPRALCRLAARRCPAGPPPPLTAWRGGARGEEGSGRTGFARRRWARPVRGALGFLGGEAGHGLRAGAGRCGAGGRHPRPAALSLFPRGAEEDGEDAIILLLKRAKVRRRPLQGRGREGRGARGRSGAGPGG